MADATASILVVDRVRDGDFDNSVKIENHFPARYKDLRCRQPDTKNCFAFQHIDVTRLSPRAMVPDRASSGIVTTFLVTKYIKGKATRKRDSRQVDFFRQEFEDAANLYVK